MKRIIVERVSKIFDDKEEHRKIRVLEDVSFDVEEGKIVGIIGRNGCGKSTLLRIIAEIYNPDKGKIFTKGKKVSLIGMNEGMDLRLTAVDNIFLCCSLLGLSNKEIKKRLNEIISFAGLEKFANTKLYKFSSGMMARLAFSIATHSINYNPDILLLDEIFAVGDEEFRMKCFKKIKDIIKNGSTVLIVSHELEMLEKICDRIIWLERGRIKKDGGVEILNEYKNFLSAGN